MTYLGEHFRVRLERVLAARCALHKLASGVDTDAYHPGLDGLQVRKRYRLADRPVIVCVSRVVPRKGQDTLIRALPAVQRRVADAALLVVGEGSYRATLERLARETGVDGDVFFTGTVPHEELPVHYAAGDVFAMPCRTRRLGLEAEGLGIVYLEAAACGLPVIAGDSGSSAEAVLEGHTGFVTDGRDLTVLTDRLVTLLQDSELARRMGTAGRAWIEREWRWSVKAQRMAALLAAN
jgi:phosphatidylinositol alpha-1,6-mannosyltransferase